MPYVSHEAESWMLSMRILATTKLLFSSVLIAAPDGISEAGKKCMNS